jgi:FkbM family methyltransferase
VPAWALPQRWPKPGIRRDNNDGVHRDRQSDEARKVIMQADKLVYDVGMCRGEDTEFYLNRGCRVVGVEANPALVASLREKFATEQKRGQLQIVDKAIADKPGRVRFSVYPDVPVWGSISTKFNERNAASGLSAEEVEVDAVMFDDVLREFGVPYYMKIDIEGLDMACIEALHRVSERPRYISIETSVTSGTASLEDGFSELAHLWVLGYRHFKYVDQTSLHKLNGTLLTAEGPPLHYRYREGSSGPFGEETRGEWQSIDGAVRQMRKLVAHHNAFGLGGLHSRRLSFRIIRRLRRIERTWWDLHARL